MINLVFGIDDDETAGFIASVTIKKALFATTFIPFTIPSDVLKYLEEQLTFEISDRNIPDLVFLDLHMPVIDGWEFLETFNKGYAHHFPDVGFIILSSSVDPKEASKARITPSVIGFYQKPLKVELLNKLKQTESLTRFFA